jgi:hypothetical protein
MVMKGSSVESDRGLSVVSRWGALATGLRLAGRGDVLEYGRAGAHAKRLTRRAEEAITERR